MSQKSTVLFWSILLFSSFAFGQLLPPNPSIRDAVHGIENNNYLHPIVPTFRTSEDGRVAMSNKRNRGSLVFQLNVPEKLTSQFLDSPAGASIVSSPHFELDPKLLGIPNASQHGHATICDPTRQFQVNTFQGFTIKNNPFVCGNNQAFDCYDLKLVTTVKRSSPLGVDLYETPIRVIIEKPKTAQASIRDIRVLGNSRRTARFDGAKIIFEPIIAGEDKRLFIGRVAMSELDWDNNGSPRTGTYDVVYSAGSDSFAPCDTRGFDHLTPVSHAPFDNDIKNKYGFAANRFRDPMGNIIPNGAQMGTTYPWIDKKATNMVMMGVNVNLYNYNSKTRKVTSRFQTRCVVNGCNNSPANESQINEFENLGDAKGFLVVGLWTHGKLVYMDNPIHNVDFGLHVPDIAQREIKLYSNGPSEGFVRVGSGRDTSNVNLQNLPATSFNTSFFESLENLWNHLPNMRPRTPRDVVWYVGNGVRTHEFAFDDYMDEGVLINSPMNAALERSPRGANDTFMKHYDGYDVVNTRFGLDIKLQNAATSQRWNIPSHGRINGSNASDVRVEPVAMGGAHAKGFFTRSSQGIVYDIPSQNQNTTNKSWFLSFFVDPRFNNDGSVRSLLRFPEGDQVALLGLNRIRFTNSSGDVRTVNLGTTIPRSKWSHLGFQVTPGGKFIRIYFNGFHIATYQNPRPTVAAFSIKEGALSFAYNYFGWVDEFKVIEGQFGFEEYCNYASGTLLGLEASASTALKNQAARYPNSSHKKIENHLRDQGDPGVQNGQKYVCHVNYSSMKHIDVNHVPSGTFSLRQKMLFPEGPLVYNDSRPDSTDNQFCLRCHSADGKRGLDLDALTLKASQWQENDRRRQPMQALRLMFGNIPAGYLHRSNPVKTGNQGIKTDRSQHPDP